MNEYAWSVPMTDVLVSVREMLDDGRSGVLATVVGVEGSAYRRPGAKMVIDGSEGEGVGHVTAGCLEDEVVDLAAEVLESGAPRLETYDLTNDGTDVWGLGVGCNGVIDVLLEPIDDALGPLVEAFDAREPVGVVTGLGGDVPLGAKAYYRDGGIEPASDRFPTRVSEAVGPTASALVSAGESDAVTVETDRGTATVFVDGVSPPPRLVAFGSGHDVGPVAELARKTGFRVTVVGFRGGIDLEERFPHADEHVATTPARLREALELDADTYAVVMTHNFVDDRLAVDELVTSPAPYVGLMGPRKRFEEMLEAFAAEGRSFDEAELERIYTPVGLDLGNGSPYGIATSIVSEVVTVHNGREPKHLADRDGPIHDRTRVDQPATD